MATGAHAAPTTPDLSLVARARAEREHALSGFPSVSWAELVRSGMVAQAQVDVLQDVERSVERVGEHAEEDPTVAALRAAASTPEQTTALASAVSTLLDVAAQPAVVGYAVTRAVDLLELAPGNAALFPGAAPASLLRVLKNASGSHVISQASRALSIMAARGVGDLGSIVHWCAQSLQAGARSPTPQSRAAVSALTALLRSPDARVAFAGSNGVGMLADVLGAAANPQEQYESTLCLWQLTFCEEALPAFEDAVGRLCDAVCNPSRQKVLRVAVAALKNLAASGRQSFTSLMVDAGMITTLANLRNSSWDDEDIEHDLREVHCACLLEYKELSSFDQLGKEVRSGTLHKSATLHTSRFWRENHRMAEQHDFAVIKALIELLDSADADTVAIACYDIGEFARFYANSKSLLGTLGAKSRVMNLLAHPDEEVQKQALSCVSKIMLENWQFVKA